MTKATTGAASLRSKGLLRNLVLLAGTTALLAACEPGANPLAAPPSASEAGDGAAAVPKTQKSTRLVDRDVEAPQVFQVTDTALWDGRPSLGGVWVASPDAKDPERVIMRNPANGKFVIGALFRREIDNPGPKLQISSDAAEALGLLAGAPGKIAVTALRREERAEATPATPILDTAESLPKSAQIAAPGAIDGGGIATKALDAPAPANAAQGAGAQPAAIASAANGALTAAGAQPAAAPLAIAPKSAAPQGTAQPAAGQPTATAPKAAAPVAAPLAAPAAAAAGGRTIQIGFFSVEANAARAVEKLKAAGVASGVRKESSNGKDYWSVTARGSADTLKKIKSAGFSDAYLLK